MDAEGRAQGILVRSRSPVGQEAKTPNLKPYPRSRRRQDRSDCVPPPGAVSGTSPIGLSHQHWSRHADSRTVAAQLGGTGRSIVEPQDAADPQASLPIGDTFALGTGPYRPHPGAARCGQIWARGGYDVRALLRGMLGLRSARSRRPVCGQTSAKVGGLPSDRLCFPAQ